MDSIEDKVQRIQQGEVQLFSDIIRAYQQQIYLYCLRMLNNKEEAEDAVQDVLIKVYEKIGYYQPQVSFTSWLYRVSYHHCLNVLRGQKFQYQLRKLFIFKQDLSTESAEQTVEKQLFSEPVASALQRLSSADRNLLILRIYEDKSFAEIGDILGKNPEVIRKRYERVRYRLKEAIERKEKQVCARTH